MDYPFREANLPPDQLEWLAKRNRAIKLYRENDNSSLAEEIGLFWNKDDEERAREAQRLRFADNPFSGKKLIEAGMAARFGPILEKRKKDTIKGMMDLFKPIVEPYTVYRAMNGSSRNSDGSPPPVFTGARSRREDNGGDGSPHRRGQRGGWVPASARTTGGGGFLPASSRGGLCAGMTEGMGPRMREDNGRGWLLECVFTGARSRREDNGRGWLPDRVFTGARSRREDNGGDGSPHA